MIRLPSYPPPAMYPPAFALCIPIHHRDRRTGPPTPIPRATASTEHPERIALRVQYRGTRFHGWAAQPSGVRTVSGVLLAAAADIVGADAAISLAGASRTDAGAHARGQVALLRAPGAFAAGHAWARALNGRLPDDVRVSASAAAAHAFDARRSALWRRYVYSLRAARAPDVFADPFAWRVGRALDVRAMDAAARSLVSSAAGDLAAFRKQGAHARHTMIHVMDARVRKADRDEEVVEIEVTANWFVYGMMRLLAAALVDVGSGEMSLESFRRIVQEGDRDAVKTSAPANGLCLMHVGYASDLDPFLRSIS